MEAAGDPPSTAVTLAVLELLLERMWAMMRVLAFLVFVQFIVMVALQFQVSARNGDIRAVGKAAARAEVASEGAKVALEAAIKSSQNPDALQAFLDSLERIKRIENRLCGGPCPSTPNK